VFFRGGFSIYVGWLTAASILNVCFLLKALGVDPQNTNVDNEMFWSKAVLIVALVLYNAYSFAGRNPLFGSVFIWVLLAIKDFQSEYTTLVNFINVLLPVHVVADLLIGAFSVYEWKTGKITHGLFM